MNLHTDQKQFDAFAKDYTQRFVQNHPYAYKLFANELRRAKKTIKQTLRILDIGCGTGFAASVLGPTAKGIYVGTDTSKESLSLLKKNHFPHLKIKTILSGAQDILNESKRKKLMKMLGGHPSLIVCNASFHQIRKTFPEIDKVLHCYIDFLAKDGLFLVGDYFYPAHLTKAQIAKSRRWIRKQIGQNPTKASGFLSPDAIIDMLESAGFEIKNSRICKAHDEMDLNYHIVRCSKKK